MPDTVHNTPKLSINVPVYNTQERLPAFLDSLLIRPFIFKVICKNSCNRLIQRHDCLFVPLPVYLEFTSAEVE